MPETILIDMIRALPRVDRPEYAESAQGVMSALRELKEGGAELEVSGVPLWTHDAEGVRKADCNAESMLGKTITGARVINVGDRGAWFSVGEGDNARHHYFPYTNIGNMALVAA